MGQYSILFFILLPDHNLSKNRDEERVSTGHLLIVQLSLANPRPEWKLPDLEVSGLVLSLPSTEHRFGICMVSLMTGHPWCTCRTLHNGTCRKVASAPWSFRITDGWKNPLGPSVVTEKRKHASIELSCLKKSDEKCTKDHKGAEGKCWGLLWSWNSATVCTAKFSLCIPGGLLHWWRA